MFQLKKNLLPLVTVDCYLRKQKKVVSSSQRLSFHQLKYGISLKISFHLYQGPFPLRGKTLNKRKRFLLARKSVSTSRNEGFRQKNPNFSTRQKKNCHWQRVSKKCRKKWLLLARKLVSPSKNKLSPAGIFFKNWIFTSRKEVLKSVSISRSKVTF